MEETSPDNPPIESPFWGDFFEILPRPGTQLPYFTIKQEIAPQIGKRKRAGQDTCVLHNSSTPVFFNVNAHGNPIFRFRSWGHRDGGMKPYRRFMDFRIDKPFLLDEDFEPKLNRIGVRYVTKSGEHQAMKPTSLLLMFARRQRETELKAMLTLAQEQTKENPKTGFSGYDNVYEYLMSYTIERVRYNQVLVVELESSYFSISRDRIIDF